MNFEKLLIENYYKTIKEARWDEDYLDYYENDYRTPITYRQSAPPGNPPPPPPPPPNTPIDLDVPTESPQHKLKYPWHQMQNPLQIPGRRGWRPPYEIQGLPAPYPNRWSVKQGHWMMA